jgi:hypothetical protein
MKERARLNRPTQADVKRYAKGVKDAGIAIGRIEIEGGRIVIIPVDQEPSQMPELDQWLKVCAHG